jgi:hypothetical protein
VILGHLPTAKDYKKNVPNYYNKNVSRRLKLKLIGI